MKVEYSESQHTPNKKKRKRKRRLKGWFVALTSIMLVLTVTTILMLTVLFNVKNVKVVGRSIYSIEQIISVSGVRQGDNIIRLSSQDISAEITKSLPYIKNVKIIKSLPDTVGIEVTAAKESILFETQQGNFVADEDYKLLRNVSENVDGLLRVKGASSSQYVVGDTLQFSEKQKHQVLKDIIGICEAKGFELEYVDVESLIDINFVINGKLYIKLGSYTDMAGKMNHLEVMLRSVEKDISASISIVDWSVDNKKAVLKYEDITNLMK